MFFILLRHKAARLRITTFPEVILTDTSETLSCQRYERGFSQFDFFLNHCNREDK